MTLGTPSARLALGLTGVIFADLATKLGAAAIAAGHSSGALVPVRNDGFSLGIAAAPLATTILLAGLGIALAGAFTLGPARRGELPTWIPACLLGGSLANLVDRIAFGSVHDFLATPWIVFNLADVAVVSGLAGLLLTRIRHSRRDLCGENARRRVGALMFAVLVTTGYVSVANVAPDPAIAAPDCTLDGSPVPNPSDDGRLRVSLVVEIPGGGDIEFGGSDTSDVTAHDPFTLVAQFRVQNFTAVEEFRASSVTATIPVPENAIGTPFDFSVTNVVAPFGRYFSPTVSAAFTSGDAGTTLRMPPFTFTAEVTSPVLGTLVCSGSGDVASIVDPQAPIPGTERSSNTPTGDAPTGESVGGPLSADGRFVAFESRAADLVPGDTNNINIRDVFRFDHVTGTTVLVNVASDETQANGDTFGAQTISHDGRFIAFTSFATNLVPVDTNGFADVFLRDVDAGTTERVSLSPDGTAFLSQSEPAGISDDGRFVLFSNLFRTFVRDRTAQTSELVAAPGQGGDISGDGRYVAFTTNDVFVRDRSTGATERINITTDGTTLSDARSPTISGDGRYVAFSASEPRAGDALISGIYVRDRLLGTTVVASIAPDGTRLECGQMPTPESHLMSDDGRVVLFNGSECTSEAYVRDLAAGITKLVPIPGEPETVTGLSRCGDYLAFNTWAPLVARDMNRNDDVFRAPTGFASGCGEGTGALSISKSLDDGGSGFAGEFTIHYDCGVGVSGDVTVAGGESTTVNDVPVGSSCAVTEPTLPDPPAGFSFAAPVITGSPATISAHVPADVAVDNALAAAPTTTTTTVAPMTTTTVAPTTTTTTVAPTTNTGALTIGFWQNKNGQRILTRGSSTGGVCTSGTWLRQFKPFQDLNATATCSQVATYVYNIIKAANAPGRNMNPMLKAQMLATALDVYFSDPALGGNKISAPVRIGGVTIDLTDICKISDGTGGAKCGGTYFDVSSAFGRAQNMTVLAILTYQNHVSNVGGTIWYGQVKATQENAKNTFDAINNRLAS